MVVAFIYMPFLISDFGLANYGVFLLASSLSVYLGLLDFGVNPTVVKRVAEYLARDRRSELSELVSNALTYYTLIGVAAALLLTFLARFGVQYLALDPADAALATRLFYVAAAVALFVWPLSIGGAVLQGLQRYDLTARVGAGVVITNLIATFGVIVTDQGPLVLFLALGVITVSSSATLCIMAARQLPGIRPSRRLISRPGLRAIFAFSWMVFVLQLAVLISDQHVDRLVLAAFAGAAAIGLYEPASRMRGLIAVLSNLPASALVPAASKLDAEEQPEVIRSLFLRGTKYTLAFVTPITVTLMVLAHPLLDAWLGPEIAPMSVGVQLFLLTWLAHSNLSVAIPMFMGMGKLRFMSWFYFGIALFNLALSLVLVRPYGVMGVIVATAIADLLFFPIGMRYALRTSGVSGREYLGSVVVRVYPLLLVPAGFSMLFRFLGATDTLLGVIVVAVVAVLGYWGMAYSVSLSPYERQDLTALLRGIRASLHASRT